MIGGFIVRAIAGAVLPKWLGWIGKIPTWGWDALAIVTALLLAWHVHAGWQKAATKRDFNGGFNVAWMQQQKQIDADARSIGALRKSIDDMNKAVDQLKVEGDTRAAAAKQALAGAREATASAEADARALEASAAKSRPSGSCAPSPTYLNMKDKL